MKSASLEDLRIIATTLTDGDLCRAYDRADKTMSAVWTKAEETGIVLSTDAFSVAAQKCEGLRDASDRRAVFVAEIRCRTGEDNVVFGINALRSRRRGRTIKGAWA